MKIYTKTGDDGTTGLFGGQRVPKFDPRIECIGAIDETNAALGWIAVATQPPLTQKLRLIQNELFVIGSQLASPKPNPSLPSLDDKSIARLESEIDAAEAELPVLKNFILPGGSESSARLHLARTIARRAERILTAFSREQSIPAIVLIYLNRLSDWLFVQARWSNRKDGVEDIPWTK